MAARRLLRLAGESGQQRVFFGAEHGRQLAPCLAADQQCAQLRIVVVQAIIDRDRRIKLGHGGPRLHQCKYS